MDHQEHLRSVRERAAMESDASKLVRARAELAQATTRYARGLNLDDSEAADLDRAAATGRLRVARERAVRAGMTFDEVHMAQHRVMHRTAGPCGPNATGHDWTD